VRKCEANALVVEPEVGRALCRDAILEHIPADAVERHERKLDHVRQRLRRALRERVS
jgi:DNA-binding response OmpR family regulator